MYKTLLILLFIPFALTATEKKGKFTKHKVIKKEYTVNKDATLNVSNKYGNIDIVTNTSNKIEINVSITTNGNDESKAQQRLNEITVAFESNSSFVSAKTIIEKSSKSWNVWGNKSNVNMEINYIIKIPVTNNVSLSNDYGGIGLDKLEGSAKINCDYGKITIGELLNSDNKINIDYTNKSNIDYINDGSINADYSTLNIEKAGRINLNADYSHITFGMVGDLKYNCDYGNLKIDNITNIAGNCDYMHTTIGKLFGEGVFEIDYGSLKINSLGENFKKLTIASSYTPIKLGLNSTNSFNIEASLAYGSLSNTKGFTFNKEIKKNTSKYYQGYFNNANSNSQVVVNSKYGSVTFTNN